VATAGKRSARLAGDRRNSGPENHADGRPAVGEHDEELAAGPDERLPVAPPPPSSSVFGRLRNAVGWPRAFDSRLVDVEDRVRSVEKRLLRRVEKAERRLEEAILEGTSIERSRIDVGRLDYPRGQIHLKLSSPQEVKRLTACAKEPWTVEWIETWLRPGETLYDIGANVGAYSLVAAEQHRGDVRVVAFEPGYATFASLCENVKLNDASERVTPLPVALGSETGLSTIGYRETGAGSAQHAVGGERSRAEEGELLYSQPLMLQSLDDVRRRFELPDPAHVKLDVDGPELAVLEGAVETLALPSLRSLMVELSVASAEAVEGFLAGQGWALRERFERSRRTPKPNAAVYALFVRESTGGR
jgi:FkbM family methyltransferase